jgi:hypothetical protein
MRKLTRLVPALVVGLALGCGKDDPNKNLKPIDPNTQPPKPANGEGKGGGPPPERPSPVIK